MGRLQGRQRNMKMITWIFLPSVLAFSFPDELQQSEMLSARQVRKEGVPLEPPSGQRCSGRNFQGRRCCTPENPCGLGEGDCDGPLDGGLSDGDLGCEGDLVCGSNNCQKFGRYFHKSDDCCDYPPNTTESFGSLRFKPRRCCTPDYPCDEGDEGLCDSPPCGGDGACKGDLVCGRNNCKKYGSQYHEKDDCCEKPVSPPNGLRCAGRNYGGRRCCTPDDPCDEGEGNCDSPGDGDRGCIGDLVCGRNNCKKYGSWYHEKDDCCEIV